MVKSLKIQNKVTSFIQNELKFGSRGFFMNYTYMYDKFQVDGVFTLLYPIFQCIFIFAIVFLAAAIAKTIPVWIAFLFGSFSCIVSGQLLWYTGIIVDELGLGGNASQTTLFLAICTTHVLSAFICIGKNRKPSPTR